MKKLLKIFPFMPKTDDIGSLAVALLFYFGTYQVAMILSYLLIFTLIFSPIGILLSYACFPYLICGATLSLMHFAGCVRKPDVATEDVAETE